MRTSPTRYLPLAPCALLALALVGCGHQRVSLEHPAAPAIATTAPVVEPGRLTPGSSDTAAPVTSAPVTSAPVTSAPFTIALTTRERGCRPAANAMVAQLNGMPGITVSPAASLTVELVGCGVTLVGSARLAGHGVAIVRQSILTAEPHLSSAVSPATVAHLIGSATYPLDARTPLDPSPKARASLAGGSRARVRPSDLRATHAALADDLVVQVSPLPRRVERRVYPNASAGSPRALLSAAVDAERLGQLDRAGALARQAWLAAPTTRVSRYVDELERLRLSSANLSAASHPGPPASPTPQ